MSEAVELPADVDRIVLSIPPIVAGGGSSTDFIRQNPGVLTILLGEQSEKILRESFLGAMTDDLSYMATWKRLRALAKKSMQEGAWVVNGSSGARMRSENHCFTPEARRLASVGVKMLARAGWVEYELD
jgi:hypothetical protein